jgi:hypothetical protein
VAVCLRACTALIVLAVPPAAFASYGLATGAVAPGLRVDAKGSAQATWIAQGSQQSFVVPRSGPGYQGTLPGGDVSTPAATAIPIAVAVRRANGMFWALQQFATTGRPTSLDLARWQGAPTRLMLATDGKHLTGSVSFHGRPVTGTSPTPAGREVKVYVYLECFGCPGAAHGWMSMLGVAPKSNGTFAVYLRPSWVGKRYRARVQGPNVGGDLAPDAQAVVDAAT